ncbi:hypothetical protein ASD24_11290 [Paenibacillus sp. Root52]|uniref:hypothetical protein n=1 Tax=Paenibacillus sp. Root52 TaxID=1736552 RepID=UPI0006F425BE|nr:hypothetical protein [Paenibacillus sp. Root52]KQY84329.1 hypothetical protein ASD24_11290 [Paenibacillus sp. Root52]
MLNKLLKYMLSVTLCLAFILPSTSTQAASSMTTLDFSNGATYYGETKNGKPHGDGTMTWSKSKTYSGSWVNGKRSGYGVYQLITRDEYSITTLKYEGNWKNDKKDGQGQLEIKEISNEATVLENQIRTGTFAKDQWVTGYDVRHGEYDPPYYFMYKDAKLSLEMMGEPGNMLAGLKSGYFFSFTYKKGNIYRNVGVGGEFSQKQFTTFIKSVEKEIKPHIDQFEKLAKQL